MLASLCVCARAPFFAPLFSEKLNVVGERGGSDIQQLDNHLVLHVFPPISCKSAFLMRVTWAPRVQSTRRIWFGTGGDLAYPNPSNETYEVRFFRPFEAALPPPAHVHPGLMVVHKPDLPLAVHMRKPTACACASAACAAHDDACAGGHTGGPDCRLDSCHLTPLLHNLFTPPFEFSMRD